jgi:hypothetical protein
MARRSLVISMVLALVAAAPAEAELRPLPDTSSGVHVWNDQFTNGMTGAQVRFVARHEDGTQKIGPRDAARLRRHNRRFQVLHYRLGIGDGPVPFRVGERWLTDFDRVSRHEDWFFHLNGSRVHQTQWDWYLMDPDSGWRRYWVRSVLREARAGRMDGVFADSLSVPHYLGAESFSPPLTYFEGERAWTRRVNSFMRYAERRLDGRLRFVPNAGSMITTRDRTDYTIPDGVMVEGCSQGGPDAGYAPADWELQLNRILRIVRRGRLVICQSYLAPEDLQARGFVLGTYLLFKGRRSFVNLDMGLDPEWFPEYGVPIGRPVRRPPRNIGALRTAGGAYVRRFTRGFAVVNPGDAAVEYRFSGTRYLVRPVGGGPLPPDASTAGWRLEYEPVASGLDLAPRSGAVLLTRRP